jgi:RNA polymerase sigma-70 factor (ECF subfamily)
MGAQVTNAQNDGARFEALYLEHRAPLLGYLARRCANPEDALDLLADVFLVAWRRIDDVPEGGAARLYLYGIARNTLMNHQRTRRRSQRVFDKLQTELEAAMKRAASADPEPELEQLEDALAMLDSDDREIVTLNAWEGLAPTAIAVVLGRSAGTVRVQLHRARKRIREALEAHRKSSGRDVAPASSINAEQVRPDH